MHKSYFLFEHQVHFLNKQLVGEQCHEIFTYQKNELVVAFSEYHVILNIGREFPCILLKKITSIKKPKYHLFKDLNGFSLLGISIIPFDKRVTFDFGEYKLVAVFYGKYPNIALTNSKNQLTDQFKESPAEEVLVATANKGIHNPRTMGRETFFQILHQEPRQAVEYLLLRHIGGVNKIMITELCFRCKLSRTQEIETMEPNDAETLWNALKDMIDAIMRSEKIYIYFHADDSRTLSLYPMEHLHHDRYLRIETFNSVNDAWIYFVEDYQGQSDFRELYEQCQQALKKRLQFIEKTLKKIGEAEDFSYKKQQSELKGNLLITFKNSITPGTSRVVLQNIFSEALENIEIDLDPKKSVMQNAQNYFNKYKNIDERRYILVTKKNGYIQERETVLGLQTELAGISKLSRLKMLHATLLDMKMIQEQNTRKPTRTSLRYSFNRLILEKEWDVYIGKNGENNDLLTFSFANNWDIWLHAQGVSGAHVVIHLPSKEINPPQEIVLKAAQVAAANSRSRHSETVPVVYTRIKHVHRIRKAPPGTVRITDEEVLFVRPMDIS